MSNVYGVEYTSPRTGERVTEWYATEREQQTCFWFKSQSGQEPVKVTKRPYTVQRARYAKGQMLVQVHNDGPWKGRAERLLYALNCRYTGRERGFIASPRKVERFERHYAAGDDASYITRKIEPAHTI